MKKITAFILMIVILATCLPSNLVYAESFADRVSGVPTAIYVGNNSNSVNIVDGTSATYWVANEAGDGIVPATSEYYTLMYDGNGTLVMNDFVLRGEGNYTAVTGAGRTQTSGLISVGGDCKLTVEFHGSNHIESRGGADYFNHAVRAESSFVIFAGDDNAELLLVSGQTFNNGPALSSGIILRGLEMRSGNVYCIGSNTGANGIENRNAPISVTGGKLVTYGENQAINLLSGEIDTEGATIYASADMSGSDLVEYNSADHSSYKYIEMTAGEEEIPENLPKSIVVGNIDNVVELVDGKNATYWKTNSDNTGVVASTSDDYNIMYDGNGTVTLNNLNLKGNGYYRILDSQTSALLHTQDCEAVTIVFHGENRIESTGGASYYRHALRGEATYFTFIGDEDATLTLISGPENPYGENLCSGMAVGGFDLQSGTLICDGTKQGGNGIENFSKAAHVSGGKLITYGLNQAIKLLYGGIFDTEGCTVLASTNMNGTDLTSYNSSSHSSYKYLEITANGYYTDPDSDVIEYDAVGGKIYFDMISGIIVGCDDTVTEVTIPETINGYEVKAIQSDVFANCQLLAKIYCSKGSIADNSGLYSDNVEIVYIEEKTFIYGDVNADSKLGADDAAIVLQKTLLSTYTMPIQKQTDNWQIYTDVSADGKIGADDASIILQKTLLSTYTMPVEKINNKIY